MVDNDRKDDTADATQKPLDNSKPFTDDDDSTGQEGGEAGEGRIAELEAKAEDNWNQFMRARAELDNLRKRHQREIEQAHKYAIDKFVGELIPIMDSLEMGLQAAQDEQSDVAKLREGTELTFKMFEQVFGRFNIETVDPVGEKFDPERHEAMSMQVSAEHPANTVMQVFQKGYLLNGRVIRPAMVVVSKGNPDDAPKAGVDTTA